MNTQVHFFRPVTKEYLHSAEIRDIRQYGSSNTFVFFKMRVAGVLRIFQFDTKQVYFKALSYAINPVIVAVKITIYILCRVRKYV